MWTSPQAAETEAVHRICVRPFQMMLGFAHFDGDDALACDLVVRASGHRERVDDPCLWDGLGIPVATVIERARHDDVTVERESRQAEARWARTGP